MYMYIGSGEYWYNYQHLALGGYTYQVVVSLVMHVYKTSLIPTCTYKYNTSHIKVNFRRIHLQCSQTSVYQLVVFHVFNPFLFNLPSAKIKSATFWITQNVSRKLVDLNHSCTWLPLIWDQAHCSSMKAVFMRHWIYMRGAGIHW